MAFFARPNLDNTQFKQLPKKTGEPFEPLTLSGQTQIATLTGLTLATGSTSSDGIIITASGASSATNNYVLTYDDTDKTIKLKQSSASGGTGIYDGLSPTTCSVGGLCAGTDIYNDCLVDIIQCMVSPTAYPDLINPFVPSFTLRCDCATGAIMNSVYEIGTCQSIWGNLAFNAGTINPYYSGSTPYGAVDRSNGPYFYCGLAFTSPYCGGCAVATGCDYDFGSASIVPASNIFTSQVRYKAGPQPLNSTGGTTDCLGVEYSGITVGSTPITSISCKVISGIYPWYWGTLTCVAASGDGRPTACCIKDGITGGTLTNGTCNKEPFPSSGTLDVTFGSTSDDYIWFAIPVCGGDEKKYWCVTTLNQQRITGGVDPGCCTFPAYNASTDLVTGVNSSDPSSASFLPWSGESYQIYVSNFQTAVSSNMKIYNYFVQ